MESTNDEVLILLNESEESIYLRSEISKNKSRRRVIEKVPRLMRQEEDNKLAYDPKVISFGPYHHDNQEFQMTQTFKQKTVEAFLCAVRMEETFLYDKVFEKIDDIRSSYVEGSTDVYHNEDLAWMMLRDACFVLYYIERSRMARNSHKNRLLLSEIGHLDSDMVLRDLFLLENQIPLMILKLLMSLKYAKEEGDELLDSFLHKVLFGEYNKEITGRRSNADHEPLHLLEAFHAVLVSKTTGNEPEAAPAPEPKSERSSSILRLLLPRKKEEDNDDKRRRHLQSFRSATDLKAKGIRFRPSPSHSLRAITFNSFIFYGQLELPVWYVSVYTKVFFLNMIAFELCPGSKIYRPVVSSYIDFMKSLIESPRDVKELREEWVLFTTLGSDEEVVNLYRCLKTYGCEARHIFQSTRKKIQQHYNSKAKTWMAEFIHDYFRSPWTVIALLAAVLLLGLTVAQTYFAIPPRA